jgi:Cell wall-active antibiotics response 4TMS YvqF
VTSVTAGRSTLPVGRIVVGLLVLAAGAFWLFDSLDVIDISWTIFFPVALIITGIGVLAASPGHTEGGLIGLGVVLSVLTVVTSVSPLDVFSGGMGQRTYAPASTAELEEEYTLGIGEMELDLSGLEVSEGTFSVKASVGMGQLRVRVPTDVNVVATGSAALGQVELLGEDQGGVGPQLETRLDVPGSPVTIELEASVGMGQVEVSS